MHLYQWVNDNNPDESLSYRKGWWDYIEFIYRIMQKFKTDDAEVVGTFEMRTPPPRETLTMPVVKIVIGNLTAVVRLDFSKVSDVWIVSISRSSEYAESNINFLQDDIDNLDVPVPGFPDEYLFGSFNNNKRKFTCLPKDEYDVVTLLTVLVST